ncbi:MAG: DUF1778 domain-containing protein [Alphaproteobacteria bacterium]|nr:DUF1778 domain-containing protein [Alphaproteobacteria bacterium]MDE2495994.1 DUF1778 domain-containing protein [Alphaproteobacteria bacterium]
MRKKPAAARNACDRTVEHRLDQQTFTLNAKQHEAFLKALDNPPPPNAKLKKLMASKSPWEK